MNLGQPDGIFVHMALSFHGFGIHPREPQWNEEPITSVEDQNFTARSEPCLVALSAPPPGDENDIDDSAAWLEDDNDRTNDDSNESEGEAISAMALLPTSIMAPILDRATNRKSPGSLTIINGRHLGRNFPLRPQETSVGRASECDIELSESSVSRHHCSFICREGVVYVRDHESANGVLLNGTVVWQPTALQHGDILDIGGCRVLLALTQSDAPGDSRCAKKSHSEPVATAEPEADFDKTLRTDSFAHLANSVRSSVGAGSTAQTTQHSFPTQNIAVARMRQAMKRRSRRAARITIAIALLCLVAVGAAAAFLFVKGAVVPTLGPVRNAFESAPEQRSAASATAAVVRPLEVDDWLCDAVSTSP